MNGDSIATVVYIFSSLIASMIGFLLFLYKKARNVVNQMKKLNSVVGIDAITVSQVINRYL